MVCDFDAARGFFKVFVLKEGRAIALPPVSVLFNAPLFISLETYYLSGQPVPHCESASARQRRRGGEGRVPRLLRGHAPNHMEE